MFVEFVLKWINVSFVPRIFLVDFKDFSKHFSSQRVHGFLGKQLQKDTNINTNKCKTRTVNKGKNFPFRRNFDSNTL